MRLKPTRRVKKRYILFKTNADKEKIEDYLFNFFGEKDFGRLFLKFIEFKEGKGIIRVNRELYYETLAALSLTSNKSNGFRVITITSSGTLNALRKKEKKLLKD